MTALLPLLPWAQVAFAVLLIGAILLQRNEASLGAAFGSSDGVGPNYQKRGIERVLFIATIVLAVCFALSVLLAQILPQVS